MVRRFRGNDLASSTLSSGVTSSTTTLPITSVSSFPTEGDFYVKLDDEIVKVTSVSGSNFTAVRGRSNTTTATHNSGVSVVSVITEEDITGRLNENGLIKSMQYGKITTASSDTGLAASDFTLINGTSSAIADGNDGIIELRSISHAGDDMTGATRPFTTANNVDIYAHVTCPAPDTFPTTGTVHSSYGLWTRANSGGAMKGISLYPGLKISAQTRATYLAGAVDVVTHGAIGRRDCYMKLTVRWDVVASTDHIATYYSWDGIHWFFLTQWEFAFGSFSCGLFARNAGQSGKAFQLLSWYEDETV